MIRGYKLEKGYGLIHWLCPAHKAAWEAKSWTATEMGEPKPWFTCDDRDEGGCTKEDEHGNTGI